MKNCDTVLLFGSPHESGTTAEMTDRFTKRLGLSRIYRLDAFKERILPCDDCGLCRRAPVCSKHDLDELHQKLTTARLIIVATPIYNLSLPAPLKAVFDRFERYFNERFSLGVKKPLAVPKQAVLLLTAGAESTDGEETEKLVRQAFSVMNAGIFGTVMRNGTDNPEGDRWREETDALADKLRLILQEE